MSRYLLLAVMPLCMAGGLFGQQTMLNVHDLQEGLLDNNNEFIYVDSRGISWISALSGLNLFDGREVVQITKNTNDSIRICGSTIQSEFLEDSHGNIYFSTGEGIIKYERASGRFVCTSFLDGTGYIIPYIFYLENDRYLWGVLNGNLIKYDVSEFGSTDYEVIAEDFKVSRAVAIFDEHGLVNKVVGFYESGNGLLFVDIGQDSIEITSINHIQNDEESRYFSCFKILYLKNINKILAITNLGWLFFEESDITVDKLVEPADLPPLVSDVCVYDNHLLIAQRNSNIAVFSLEEESWGLSDSYYSVFNLDENALVENIEKISVGQNGTIWLENSVKGVCFGALNNNRAFAQFQIFGQNAPPIVSIFSNQQGEIAALDQTGNSWRFTEDGPEPFLQEFPPLSKAKTTSSKNTWLISPYTIGLFSESGQIEGWWTAQDTLQASFFDLVELPSGRVIVVSSVGLYELNKNTPVLELLVETDTYLICAKIDGLGSFWTSDAMGQICRWTFNADSSTIIDSIGSTNAVVNQLALDEVHNCMWAATAKGLFKYDLESLAGEVFDPSNGFPVNYIQSIAIDSNHDFWLGTNKGVYNLTCNGISFDLKNYLNQENGLSSESYIRGAAFVDPANNIWFGGNSGVDKISLPLSRIGDEPKAIIRRLLVNGEPWLGSKSIQELDSLQLSYDQNTLRFKLSATEYTDPVGNQFQVYLENDGSTDTIYLEDNNEFILTNLDPGHYYFGYSATNSERDWSAWKKLYIRIKPHWTQMTGVRAAALLLAIATLIALIVFRYQSQLRKQALDSEREQRKIEKENQEVKTKLILESERNRIAMEMHDELGSGLSSIIGTTARAKDDLQSDQLEEHLDRITELARESNVSMRDLIWAMDPEFDKLDELIAKIRWFGGNFAKDVGLSIKYDGFEDDIPSIPLSSQTRHNLFKVIKELFNNIAKSAGASSVQLAVRCSDAIHIELADNGKGFDFQSSLKQGYGLRNCQSRIRALNGEISWSSGSDTGTLVSLRVPLPSSTT